MLRENLLLRWLVVASLADWLISRSLARMAIFMPKTSPILAAYQGLTWLGQFASMTCALLGLITLVYLAWRLWKNSRGFACLALICLLGLNLLFLISAPDPMGILISGLLSLAIVAWLGWKIWTNTARLDHRIMVMLPALAIGIGNAIHVWQALFAALKLPGPAPLLTQIFNLGELLAVLSPLGLWWAYGQRKPDRRAIWIYLIASLPAALFLLVHTLNPAMTGILAVWSTGLTLYLPAWLYALSLWLGVAAVVVSRQNDNPAGWALILLASAGYAPQLSSQITLSLIALSLLAGLWAEPMLLAKTTSPQSIAKGVNHPHPSQQVRT